MRVDTMMAQGDNLFSMKDPVYRVRNYQASDFDKFSHLIGEAEKLEPAGRDVSRQHIAEHLDRPHYFPEQDLFVVETDDQLVGYMDVVPELTIDRVILECWVHPKHRRRGLALKLLGLAVNRARELGAKAAHVNITRDNEAAKRVLSRLGFESVREFLELRLEMVRLSQPEIEQATPMCRHLRQGEEDKLTQIQNRAFTGSWGYNLNTVETITYRTSLSEYSSEDVLLACEGDRVIGYCWTEVINRDETANTETRGRIYMIGVDPDYRGRGVGRRVLLAGLAYLMDKNLRICELTVDGENKAALVLYRSLGFKPWKSSLWYEKHLG
jgi:mycothiol synthase